MYENHYSKWWIYLTHWGLLACTLQSWLAAIIVTSGTMVDRDDFGKLNLINKKIEKKINLFWKNSRKTATKQSQLYQSTLLDFVHNCDCLFIYNNNLLLDNCS